ncbi:MAG TPA: SH3 domain-containing protein [Terriglobales bacterium]
MPHKHSRCWYFVLGFLVFFSPSLFATERGIMMRDGIIYISPDTSSAKLSNISRGREVAVIERTPGWVHVVGTVDVSTTIEFAEEVQNDRNVTGWILDKGVIMTATPDGDKILFGEAFDSEMEASRRGGRRGAAQDAMRIYARLAEYFPTSPLAGESLYRSADIRWQIESADRATLPSAKMRDPGLRAPVDEEHMKQVIKKFPRTKWADLAAYHLIDNKLCGEWEALAKCPEKEAEIYLKYADERPQSPKAAEALYKAAWRYAALVVIYTTDNQPKKADDSSARAINVAKKLISQYSNDEDWSNRAERLIYMVQNKIPTYGNNVE